MNKAVTLIELLVIISIIGILVAVTVPSAQIFLPGIRLNGTARSLASNLREAQEYAISQQNQHLIRFVPAEAPISYQLIRLVPQPDGSTAEEFIKQVNLPPGLTLTLEGTMAATSQVIFSADGGPSSSGDITLSNSSANKKVNVSPAGFIKIK